MIVLAIAICASTAMNFATCRDEMVGEYATFEDCGNAGSKVVGSVSDAGDKVAGFTCRNLKDEAPIPATKVR